jgi:hypothetical protein
MGFSTMILLNGISFVLKIIRRTSGKCSWGWSIPGFDLRLEQEIFLFSKMSSFVGPASLLFCITGCKKT